MSVEEREREMREREREMRKYLFKINNERLRFYYTKHTFFDNYDDKKSIFSENFTPLSLSPKSN